MGFVVVIISLSVLNVPLRDLYVCIKQRDKLLTIYRSVFFQNMFTLENDIRLGSIDILDPEINDQFTLSKFVFPI